MSGLERVSDAERQQVVDLVSRHFADGRLSLDEADERMGEAWRAVTRADLDHVLRDLPVVAAGSAVTRPPAVPITPRARRERRPLPDHLRVYVLVIGFLCLVWLFTGAGYFWPIWPALGWGLGIALRSTKHRDEEPPEA